MRWDGQLVDIVRREMHTEVSAGTFKEDVGINEMITPKLVSQKQDMGG
jgi:hypothetical protein